MLFQRELTIQILEGRKTETRRRVQIDREFGTRKPCYYRKGGNYGLCRPMLKHEATERELAILDGRAKGRPPKVEVGRILIVSVDLQQLGDIDEAAARREGFANAVGFKSYWVGLHDKQWIKRQEKDNDDGLSNEDLAVRFDAQWADVEVYAIRFEVQDTVVYLAERGHGDYVTTERDQHGRRVAMTSEIATRSVDRDASLPAGVAGWSHGERLLAPEEAVPAAIIDGWIGDKFSAHERIKQNIRDGRKTGGDRRAEVRSKAGVERRIQIAIATGKDRGIPTKAKVNGIRYAMHAGRASHVERLLADLERLVARKELTHAA